VVQLLGVGVSLLTCSVLLFLTFGPILHCWFSIFRFFFSFFFKKMADFLSLLGKSKHDQESPVIRFDPGVEAPVSGIFGMETPAAIFTWAVETHGEKRCVGFRKIIGHVGTTRLLGDWQYYTYREVGQRVMEMGAGLRKLMKARSGFQRIHMAAATGSVCFINFSLSLSLSHFSSSFLLVI
jgi:hypothetical protein